MSSHDVPTWGLRIGGRSVPASDGATMPVTNPATGAIIAQVAQGTAEDVGRAVAAAQSAYESGWGRSRPGERAEALRKLAALIREHAEELALLESRNVGKPIASARGEVLYAARVYEYYAGLIPVAGGQTFPLNANGVGLTFREPLGVCGLIVPWNFPLVIMAWKAAPALAMGNACVVKPAEWTPLSALRLAELALEAGFPEGALNVVPGLGPVAGAALTAHPDARKISFTGSTATGVKVMQAAAETIKRVSLELGGKSASVVFADADLEKASASVMSVFDNTGQDCCARSRYLVERSIYDEFVERFAANARALRVGDPMDEATEIGPLVAQAHRERVQNFVRQGVGAGARCVLGGDALTGSSYDGGFYYAPSIFTEVAPDNVLAQQEVFGPVVAMLPFDTEEEAIRLANASIYGLSGSLWTRDAARALRVARGVQAGVLSVNSSSSVHLEMPFGGFKQSGLGRELGPSALEQYSEVKSVFIAME